MMRHYRLFILTTVQVWITTATKILYVSPDNSTNVNCPSQPCATLSQYLLDNGTLPVVSNVGYHFLPGEHHVPANMILQNLYNFSIIGTVNNSSSPVVLVGCSQSYVINIINSHFVNVNNVVFKYCSKLPLNKSEITNLQVSCCFSCKIEKVTFLQYGFTGLNLIGKSYLCNIKVEIIKYVELCCQRIFLRYNICPSLYHYSNYSHVVIINQLLIHRHITYRITAHQDNVGLYIHLDHTFYHISILLANSYFHNMNRQALKIKGRCSTTTIIIHAENCTFKDIVDNPIIIFLISPFNRYIYFINCNFHDNVGKIFLSVGLRHNPGCNIENNLNSKLKVSTNINFVRCEFSNNKQEVLIIENTLQKLGKVNVLFESLTIYNTKIKKQIHDVHETAIIFVAEMNVRINGSVNIVKNKAQVSIAKFKSCDVLLNGKLLFDSNCCSDVLFMDTYMKVTEDANITFVNNKYHDNLIVVANTDKYYKPNPFCFFQYIAIDANINVNDLLTHYTITFIENSHLVNAHRESDNCSISFCYFISHCKWVPSAAFYHYSPEVINQQIIQNDNQNCNYHTHICYCSDNINCSIDTLGAVYPGQTLQTNLCNMCSSDDSSVLYAEVHDINLPTTACKIAHQSQLINVIGNHSNTVNYTIISRTPENNICELFLTASPYLNKLYDVFYVQLLPCPIGFTLQDGVCQCDPILPDMFQSCLIDHSAIRRPANTWITAHTQTNDTKYLISDCPMDYCLPYSSNVNLLYPDSQCQFNRTAILCSQCQHHLSMVLGSSRCMECTNLHILIIIIVIVAGIVLVILLYLLNLTVTIGTINGIIFYANVVSINDSVFLLNDNVFKPLRVFIYFVNLNIGTETCFYNGMDSYFKTWLKLFFPIYLVIISATIVIASRYSSRILRLTYTRSLPVLATLFLLSYTGVLRTVLTVLFSYSTITHLPSGHQQIVWSIDASVPLFGLKFTILFITCLVLFLLLIPFNITLLFTRYLLRFRLINHFKPILDAFQGSYKDRYYYWVAVHMTMRSLLFAMYAFQASLKLILSTILLIIFSIYSGYIHPYKNKLVNIEELLLLLNLTIMYAVSYQSNEYIFTTVTNTMLSLAFIQLFTTLLYHFLTYTCHCNVEIALQDLKNRIMNCFRKNHFKRSSHFDVELLNIPECTFNYTEYQDGLVSDDFR